MKKIFIVFIILTVSGVYVNASDKTISNCKTSLRLMFVGQSLVAESVAPLLALAYANYHFYGEIIHSGRAAVMFFSLDSIFLGPLFIGLYIYMKGRAVYKNSTKDISDDFSKLVVYLSKLRMFRTMTIAFGILTGIGTSLSVPGAITTSALYGGSDSLVMVPLLVSGIICLSVSLPMLLSSILMISWIRDKNWSLSPILGFSRDEGEYKPEDGLAGYTFKLGLKVSI